MAYHRLPGTGVFVGILLSTAAILFPDEHQQAVSDAAEVLKASSKALASLNPQTRGPPILKVTS